MNFYWNYSACVQSTEDDPFLLNRLPTPNLQNPVKIISILDDMRWHLNVSTQFWLTPDCLRQNWYSWLTFSIIITPATTKTLLIIYTSIQLCDINMLVDSSKHLENHKQSATKLCKANIYSADNFSLENFRLGIAIIALLRQIMSSSSSTLSVNWIAELREHLQVNVWCKLLEKYALLP